MNELNEIIKDMKNIINSLKKILNEEHVILLHNDNYLDTLNKISDKKKELFKQFQCFQEQRIDIEKKYNFFAPYNSNKKLHFSWNEIIQECLFLKEINLKNQKILNEKFYINQNFLDILALHSKDVTYDENGNLEY
ncbi:flagellar export chaperone FlgN [Buchnera aphidicola]|uniref:flagellar export chaperone FlgN n=1 Tax=Buchnera aphidicola TaxID=9 RepID=UPI00346433E3